MNTSPAKCTGDEQSAHGSRTFSSVDKRKSLIVGSLQATPWTTVTGHGEWAYMAMQCLQACGTADTHGSEGPAHPYAAPAWLLELFTATRPPI